MKQVGVFGALLAAALVGSYMTWTAEDPGGKAAAASVPVYQAQAEDLQKITWTSEKLTVVLERKRDERGDFTWITTTERTAVAPALEDPAPEAPPTEDPAESPADVPSEGGEEVAEEAPPAPAATEETLLSFRGNEASDELWKSFAPLLAMRELPEADAKSEVFGFAPPKGTLEVVRRSGAVHLDLGGETYGTKDRYVAFDGRVFLLDDATLSPLERAKTRLVERLLVPASQEDADEVSVQAVNGARAFVHRNKADRAKAFWAASELPDTTDDAATAWLDKVFRLRVQAYVEAGALPELEPVFAYRVKKGAEAWSVEVLREKGAAKPNYYARSEYARSVVQLPGSLVEDVVADLDVILTPATGDAAP